MTTYPCRDCKIKNCPKETLECEKFYDYFIEVFGDDMDGDDMDGDYTE